MSLLNIDGTGLFQGSILNDDRSSEKEPFRRIFKKRLQYIQKGLLMLEEASEFIGLQVYTPNGIFLGNVDNLVIDLDKRRVDGLFISETNPLLVEDSKAVNVPFRWIQAVGDIIILKYFPKRVTTKPPESTL